MTDFRFWAIMSMLCGIRAEQIDGPSGTILSLVGLSFGLYASFRVFTDKK